MIDDQFVGAADKIVDNRYRKGLWELWAKYVIRRHSDGGRYIVAVDRDDSELPPRVNLGGALEKTGGTVRAGSHEAQLVRQAVKRTKRRKQGNSYYPLVDDPDLFLKFARLADSNGLDNAATVDGLDTDKNADAALDWISTFGVLGLTPVEVDGFRGASTRGGKASIICCNE